ncbi:RUN domain containing protein 3A [Echinococcus multilocularis]|uniref:RUN domain containing protein 3A n=1 Tax=Echinococcus multilocularis TaxID=6211 RepID=A0A068YDH4_ECHMU|nr:RUN domain containing protein 3A [Echinococcus multilocularis]
MPGKEPQILPFQGEEGQPIMRAASAQEPAYISLVIERNKSGILDETSHGVCGLLTCLESIFCDAPGDAFKWWKGWKLWRWVAQSCENMPQSCVGLVNSLEHLQSGLAKLRAFLRLALQSKRLHLYLDVLFNSTEVISRVYHPTAILLSTHLGRITDAAVELQYLDFCFDMRADELNFPYTGQIDYALLLSFTNSSRYPNSNFLDTGYHLQNNFCKQCQEYAVKALSSESQKKYLEDVVRGANKKIVAYESELARLLDDNRRLRSAFDQLQTKFALMHEEYAQRLRRLGFDTQVFPIRLKSHWRDISRPHQRWRPPVDWSAVEATEDLNDLRATETQTHATSSPLSLPLFPQKGRRVPTPTPRCAEGGSRVSSSKSVDMSAIEATEDLDVVDLLYEPNIASSTFSRMRPLLRVERPRPRSFQFAMGEQEALECSEVYRLSGATDAISPFTSGSLLDLSQLLVTVKPSNINYRARFSVPKTVVGGSSRRSPPQLDLLSELQQTDSSFPLTGLSLLTSEEGGDGGGGGGEETEGACSTSDQVSDIVNEVAPEEEIVFGSSASGGDCGGCTTTTSSSINTVLTSTSTVRPTNVSSSLTSSPSIHKAKAATEPPRGTFRRSTSDLPTTTTASMTVTSTTGRCQRHVVSPPCFTPTSLLPQLNI